MLNLRYIVRLIGAFTTRFKGILFIGVILGIGVFFIFRFAAPVFQRNIEKIGVTGRYHTDSLPPFILQMISDGLTYVAESGTVEPNLAASWESPDKGKTWIFTLADDSVWQDGTPVTSDTIVYEFSDVEIEKTDKKTIIFKLQEPFSPFPSVVSAPTFRRGLLGTGEWKVDDISLTGNFVQKLVIVKDKKNKRIYKFYPTEAATKLAFKLGEVDRIINMFDATPFTTWKTVDVKAEVNTNQVVTLFFNSRDVLLSEKTVRQALSYAIDKEKQAAQRVISPILPKSWAYNSQIKPYNYDRERAKEIIEKLPDEVLENLPVKLVTTPQLLSLAESIAKDWSGVGVETIIQVSSIIPSEFQAFLAIFDISTDPDQYSVWHSTQTSTNISKYSSPRIDKLLEDGRSELDFEERRKIYLDFQRFLVEDSPAAFLYHPTYYTIIRK
jgi:peptide/nickel transport system substrate-binding protein